MLYKEYLRAKSLEEAYELAQKKNNVVLGGTLWLKMGKNQHGTAIDLCDLGLDKIEETKDEYRIGAYVHLREIEVHEGLNTFTNGAMEEAMRHIVGVQFRNVATVGGSVYGRYGFSDVYTILLALDARVVLYKAGEMSLEEFAAYPRANRDILTHIIIPKKKTNIVYITQRNARTDFPVLTCAVAVFDGGNVNADEKVNIRTVIGARPALAEVVNGGENILAQSGAEAYASYVSEHMEFSSNMRGSEKYRRRICEVLVRRALEQLVKGEEVQ